MIKSVVLDLDGVFFESPHNNLVKTLSERIHVDEDTIRETLFVKAANEGGYNKLKCGKLDADEYWHWLFSELGVLGKFNKSDYLELLTEGYKLNIKCIGLIDELHKKGIKTAVCSNNYKDNIDNLERRFQISKYFDVMIFSYNIGVMKPDPLIFKALIKECNVRPEEIFYTDDKEDKLETPKSLGINTAIYTDFEKLVRDLNSLSVA